MLNASFIFLDGHHFHHLKLSRTDLEHAVYPVANHIINSALASNISVVSVISIYK